MLQRREEDRETRNQAKVAQLELAEQWQVSSLTPMHAAVSFRCEKCMNVLVVVSVVLYKLHIIFSNGYTVKPLELTPLK